MHNCRLSLSSFSDVEGMVLPKQELRFNHSKKKLKAFDTIVQDRSAIISACLRKTLFGFGGGKKQKLKKHTYLFTKCCEITPWQLTRFCEVHDTPLTISSNSFEWFSDFQKNLSKIG